jgi:hypothetical protein
LKTTRMTKTMLILAGFCILAPAASTVSASTYQVSTKSIYLNGKCISKPAGFAANGTTYMPIWYLMQTLNSLNIKSTWQNGTWNLSLPANVTPNLSEVTSSGAEAITINGTLVEHVNGIAYKDPSTGNATTYFPIWYAMQMLQKIGVVYKWDGTNWNMNYTPVTVGNSDNYNVDTASIRIFDKSSITTSGFFHGTEYMPIADVQNALTTLGVQNTISQNDWYLNQSGTVSNLASTDPAKPITIHANGQLFSATPIVYGGSIYIPIWPVMNALSAQNMFSNWDGHTFLMSQHAPITPVVNPHQTYTYSQMLTDLNKLSTMYPDLIQEKVIGTSAYGRDIYAVSVGKGPASILINGSHHAREWITTNLNMYMLDEYAEAYEKEQSINGLNVKQILDQTKIWFIPMVNPDGVTLSQLGPSAFPASIRSTLLAWNNGSDNFTRWKANAQGIDLNRQYDGGWSDIWYDPVTHPWYEDYKGQAPYSAPETQAVLNGINQINPQIITSYHASGGLIYFEYKVTGAEYTVDHTLASHLSTLTGYPLRYPAANPSGGGLTDWWTHNEHRPGFTIEIGPFEGEYPVPIQYFDSIWSQNKAVGLYLAEQGYQQYVSHPDSAVHVP